jgi:hypothetical protein
LLLELEGLSQDILDVGPSSSPSHQYYLSVWKPDPTIIETSGRVSDALGLITHKRGPQRVMEINMTLGDSSSVWLQNQVSNRQDSPSGDYHLYLPDQEAFSRAQETYGESGYLCDIISLSSPSLDGVPGNFDLIVVKNAVDSQTDVVEDLVRQIKGLMSRSGFLLVIHQGHMKHPRVTDIVERAGFRKSFHVADEEGTLAELFIITANSAESPDPERKLCIELAHFSLGHRFPDSLKAALIEHNYQVVDRDLPFTEMGNDNMVIVWDEVESPLLADISEETWHQLKTLILEHRRILWITQGSQINVTYPNNALVHGLFRTIRSEDPKCQLVTLDVQDGHRQPTISAILALTQTLQRPEAWTSGDWEFAETDGAIHISRVVRDDRLGQQLSLHQEQSIQPLQQMESPVRLRIGRPGSLDSLYYAEESVEELQIEDGHIEIDIFAVGLGVKVSNRPLASSNWSPNRSFFFGYTRINQRHNL